MAEKKKESLWQKAKRRAKKELDMLKNSPKGFGASPKEAEKIPKGSDRGGYKKKRRGS